MNEIQRLIKKIDEFREKRDWKQFHNPKDLALSLNLEASEVLEHFQWKDEGEIKEYIEENREEVGEEIADVFYWILLLSHDLDIDLVEALEDKLEKNAKKYPVEKARGKSDKYTEL